MLAMVVQAVVTQAWMTSREFIKLLFNFSNYQLRHPMPFNVDWQTIDDVLLDMDGTLLDLHYDATFWLKTCTPLFRI